MPCPPAIAPATDASTIDRLTGSLQRKQPSRNTPTITRKAINSVVIEPPYYLNAAGRTDTASLMLSMESMGMPFLEHRPAIRPSVSPEETTMA